MPIYRIATVLCRRMALRRRVVFALSLGSLFIIFLFSMLTHELLNSKLVNTVNAHSFPSMIVQEKIHANSLELKERERANVFASGKLSLDDKPNGMGVLNSLMAQHSTRDLMAVNIKPNDSVNMSKRVHHLPNDGQQAVNGFKENNDKNKHFNNLTNVLLTDDQQNDRVNIVNVVNKLSKQLNSLKGLSNGTNRDDFNKGFMKHQLEADSHDKENEHIKQLLEAIFTLMKKSNLRYDKAKLSKIAEKLLDTLGQNRVGELLSTLHRNEEDYTEFKGGEYPLQVDVKEMLLEYKRTRKTSANITNTPFNILLNPKVKCQPSDDENDNDIFVLFIVKTSPNNFESRKTIRTTWGDEKRFPNMRIVFSMGIPGNEELVSEIQSEWNMFNDILFADYKDTYFNLTLKTTTGINWATKYCKFAKYVVSVDDDIYVATDFLISYLENLKLDSSHRLFSGHVYKDSEPIRKSDDMDEYYGKWILSKKEYPWDVFPPYVFGGFVVMSRATLLEFNFAIKFTEMFKFEDVYLGILANRLGITATNIDRVNNFKTRMTTGAFKTAIASHYYTTPKELRQAWECHLGIVERNIEKFVYCNFMKPMLKSIKTEIDNILLWMDDAQSAV